MSSFHLEIPSNITCLAGYEYGKEIWNTQCLRDDFEANEDHYISFPEQIEGVTISWVDGFFEYLIETIGAEKTAEQIHINNKRLEIQVRADLLLYKDTKDNIKEQYSKYAALASKISRRAKKIASLDLNTEAQPIVSGTEEDFYIALVEFLKEIAYTYEADPTHKYYFYGHLNKELILQELKKLF